MSTSGKKKFCVRVALRPENETLAANEWTLCVWSWNNCRRKCVVFVSFCLPRRGDWLGRQPTPSVGGGRNYDGVKVQLVSFSLRCRMNAATVFPVDGKNCLLLPKFIFETKLREWWSDLLSSGKSFNEFSGEIFVFQTFCHCRRIPPHLTASRLHLQFQVAEFF